jgi:hypothetical protein
MFGGASAARRATIVVPPHTPAFSLHTGGRNGNGRCVATVQTRTASCAVTPTVTVQLQSQCVHH